jgi:hypothetical protein
MDDQTMTDLITQANDQRERMRGLSAAETGALVKQVIDESDVVWGVFPDKSRPDGAGLHLIKGRRSVSAEVASGEVARLLVSAVPCVARGHAVSAERTWGDGSTKAQ